MAFMTRKKRYKFDVECCLVELTQVPFLSAVLFAKVRVPSANFKEHTSREELRNNAVRWDARFRFECKMSANANTGVLEPALMRISVRMEVMGGRSCQKHGFCDVDLAALAGSGETTRRYLLEGYANPRKRQDNSVLKITIKMNMTAGDPLFKVPQRKLQEVGGGDSGSESAPANEEDNAPAQPGSALNSLTRRHEQHNGNASAETGTAAPTAMSATTAVASCETPTELDAGSQQPISDHPGLTLSAVMGGLAAAPQAPCLGSACLQQHSHSRNSSSTSGDSTSKASGYGSSASAHSRQSSDGDSAPEPQTHPPRHPNLHHHSVLSERTTTAVYVPSAPKPAKSEPAPLAKLSLDSTLVGDTSDDYLTPNSTLTNPPDVIPRFALLSPPSEEYKTPVSSPRPESSFAMPSYFDQKKRAATSLLVAAVQPLTNFQIFKQKSLNTIPALLEKNSKLHKVEELFVNFPFLTPLAQRKNSLVADANRLAGCLEDEFHSVSSDAEESRVKSLSSQTLAKEAFTSTPKGEGPAERPKVLVRSHFASERLRRPHTVAPSVRLSWRDATRARNPSSGSLSASASECGSLERRPAPPPDPPPDDNQHQTCRVETTRVDPDMLIDELLAATDLKHAPDDTADTSGLQLFVSRDGTAALGGRQRVPLAHHYKRVVLHPAAPLPHR